MVGLSVILEVEAKKGFINKVISMSKPSSTSGHKPLPTSFLDHCFLCQHKILPANDIYMYKGDRAFCSEECRFRQILMDEEETSKSSNCSLAAMKSSADTPPSSSSSSSNSSSRKGVRNRANFN